MKDSGIEWLGQVPAHWEVVRVKSISLFITSGPRGWSERIQDAGALFIQSGDLSEDMRLNSETAKRVPVAHDAEAYRTQLSNGDIVVCITGAKTGNVAICDGLNEEAFINQHLSLIRPKPLIHGRFLAFVLKGDAGRYHLEVSQYGLKQGLSLEDVAATPLALPPINEQEAILEHLASAMRRSDTFITEATQAIALLRERRAALISAAVTGKIDVRALATSQPEAA
jgi:type I restriction enzyme S subunit